MAYRSSAPDLADRDRDRPGRWERDRYSDIRERFEDDDDHVYTRRDLSPRAPPAPPRERSAATPRYRSGPPPPWEEDDNSLIRERRRVYDDHGEQRLPPLRRRPSPPPTRYYSPSPPRSRPGAPGGRPGGLLRRPSSLDTFERKQKVFYEREREREEYDPPARRGEFRAPPYQEIPLPLPRSRALPPPRYREQEYYDEIRVSDPDRYGDDDFRGFPAGTEKVRERKIVKTRRRSRSRDSRTTRSFRSSSRSSSSSSSTSTSGATTVTARSEYPKKGKTRVPARLVSRRALIDLEYPFVEEGNTIVIQKALGQHNIDDLLKLSDDYKKSERELEAARSLPGDIIEERRVTFEEAPVVVAAAPRPPTPVRVVEEKTAIIRDVSPARTYTTTSYTSGTGTTSCTSDSYSTSSYDSSLTAVPHVYHTHTASVPSGTTVVREVSGDMPVGPVAIVDRSRHSHSHGRHSHSRSRSRHTRHSSIGRGGELVRAERLSTGELVLYEESVERVEAPRPGVRIEKDRRGPPPKLMKAMLATLT